MTAREPGAVPLGVPVGSSQPGYNALPGLLLGDPAPTTLLPSQLSASSPQAGPPSRTSHRLRSPLSTRDRHILLALSAFRLMTGGQLQALLFIEGTPATRSRRARRTLARLTERRLVHRLGRQIGGVHGGSAGYIYALTGRGQALINAKGPAGGRRRRQWEPSLQFADHLLAIADLYIDLVWRDRTSATTLGLFQPEPLCWRHWSGLAGERHILKPDAACTLTGLHDEQLWFIEIDRGTESSSVIGRQCQAYLDYHATGLEQAREGVFPQVLWIVPDQARARLIASVLARLPPPANRLFAAVPTTEALYTLTAPLDTNPTTRKEVHP